MSYLVRDLTPVTGSEISITPDELLNPAVAQEMRELLVQRGVLVFPKINLSDEQQLELSRLMGTLREEGQGGVIKITLDDKVNKNAAYLKGSMIWHMDGTHDQIPAFATLLTGQVLSQVGGQTVFANAYAAYEELSAEMKEKLANLTAEHSVETSSRKAGMQGTPEEVAYWNKYPPKQHKIIWTHKSGRKSLVVGVHASHVVEMDREEGEALLQELLDWTTQDRFVYRHEWSVGDLLIWDNTGVLHRAEPYPADSGRLMRRTTLEGEESFS